MDKWIRSPSRMRILSLASAFMLLVVGFGSSNARAQEPIVGLWQITVKDSGGNIVDSVFSGWTSDGLEFDQDISPILIGEVCYGSWIKLGDHKYALTHPFFNFMDLEVNGEGTEATEGFADGTSGYLNYVVTVSNDGKTFSGRENLKAVAGLNPYDPKATAIFSESGLTLSATKIEVDKSLLP